MSAIDKEIGQMAVFNQREENTFDSDHALGDDTGKFSGITSV